MAAGPALQQVRATLRENPADGCKILLPMIATIADGGTVKIAAKAKAEEEALGGDARSGRPASAPCLQ